MPVDVLALPSSSMNTKWKEPYASASLNQKLVGVIAPGIYRGLLLQPDLALGDRTIVVQTDPIKLDHVAVYENANGFSVTYRDGISGNITLSLTAYSSVTVVVCVFIDYATGVATTGSFRVYTVAEFNALSAAIQNALVVLGTVVIPVSGVIPAGNISPLRRTLASANFQEGMIQNSPLVRNPGFEIGATNATYPKSSIFWDKSVTAGTATWKTSTAVVGTGLKAVEINVTAGAMTGDLSQQVGIETAAGEQFFASISIKQLKTISSGTLQFFMEWSDVNDALLTTTTQSLDGGGVDVAFRTVPVAALAPAGAVSLRTIGIRATALSPLTFGIFAYIDNVDVTVVPRNPKYPYPLDQAFRRNEATTGLVVEDRTGNFGSLAALLGFDLSTPASEGRAFVERRDQDYSGANLPPALALFGRLFQLGSKLLGTEANALKPRVSADTSTAVGVDFTLMWESGRVGETTGTYTQPVVRIYASNDGQWVLTSNTVWGGTTWAKDVAGQNATKIGLAKDGWRIYTRVSDIAWSDTAWADTLRVTNPLETVSDARTPRFSMNLHDGADTTELTLISQFNFTGNAIRTYAVYAVSGPTMVFMLTTNAAWNGTNWVKDFSGKASTRIHASLDLSTIAYTGDLSVRFDTCQSTDVFPESDWSAIGTSSTTPSFGGQLLVGQGVFGAINSSVSNPQGLVSTYPDFGDVPGSGNERMDPRPQIDAGNWSVDSFGLVSTIGPQIREEFITLAPPSGWSNAISGTGSVVTNDGGLTVTKFVSGTGVARVQTDSFVVTGAYSGFNMVVRWDNVTGTFYGGLVDGSFNHDFGFDQDSGTYGNENIHIVLRTGAGLQNFDTGISPASKLGDWWLLSARCAGGSGLFSSISRVYWSIKGKSLGSGVWNPGGPIVNGTTGRKFIIGSTGGGQTAVDRLTIGGYSNFGL